MFIQDYHMVPSRIEAVPYFHKVVVNERELGYITNVRHGTLL